MAVTLFSDKHQSILYFKGFVEGMKPAGVWKLFQRSGQNCGIWYRNILMMVILKGFLMTTHAKPVEPLKNFNV
jgi:hypothetical protein